MFRVAVLSVWLQFRGLDDITNGKSTMRRLIISLLMLVTISASPLILPLVAAPEMRMKTIVIVTSTGRHLFAVEIADTPSLRRQGLMQRTQLAPDSGMLFDNGADREMYMWMKDTILSLDMIFIKKDGVVVKVAKKTVPFSESIIASGVPVRGVLEVIAGTADRINLKPGDRIELPLFG